MIKTTLFCISTLLLSFFSQSALAYDFFWSGNYSSEANFLSGVDLGNSKSGDDDKFYINHHLFLQPEVILFSGLSVKGAFDVLNSGSATLPSSQRIGQILGGNLTNSSLIQDQNSIFIDRIMERNRGFSINEAYLEYAHTKGVLLVGRLPLHFGLGAFYNKGHNVFDHWFTNRDGLAYEFQFGNLHFKPMFSFLTDSLNIDGKKIIEYGLKFNFKVESTGLDLGAMILQRSISAETNEENPAPGVTRGSAKPIFLSLFYQRTEKTHSYGLEGFFQTKDIGEDVSGNSVSLKGFGIALEGEFRAGKWDFKGKAGYATGDDADANSYSAVAFNRNYNLGLILFNHPLGTGTFDPTQTNSRGRLAGIDPSSFVASQTADTDAISNSIYFAPSLNYNLNSAWNLGTTLVFAWLQETELLPSGKVSSYLGSEVDLTLTYKPTESISCSGIFGFLFPGSAFEGDGSLETDLTLGSTINLGITF